MSQINFKVVVQYMQDFFVKVMDKGTKSTHKDKILSSKIYNLHLWIKRAKRKEFRYFSRRK